MIGSEKESPATSERPRTPELLEGTLTSPFSRMVSRTLSTSLSRALRSAARHQVSSPLFPAPSVFDTTSAASAVVCNGCEHTDAHHRDNYTPERSHRCNRVPSTCTDGHCRCLDRRGLSRRDRQNEWDGALFGTYGIQGNKSQEPTRARVGS